MEPVGLLGIIKLTSLILRKNFKHFLCILTLLWVIPFAFHLPLLDVSSFALDALVASSLALHSLLVSTEQYFPPSTDPAASLPPINTTHPAPFPQLHLSSFFPLIARFFFSVTIALISYPLLTFSVCRACLNKSICLKGSLLGVLRSAKNLVRTLLCVGLVVLGLTSVTVGIMGIITVAVVAVRGNDPVTVSIVLCCMAIAMVVAGVYLTVLFSLAHTSAILEEKTRGWEAMRRSMDLLKGRKWLALGLVCVVYVLLQPCRFWARWQWRGGQIVRVSLEAVITLFGVVANVVLYMSCKSHKEEPLNTLIAGSAQFGPPDPHSSPKSQAMDVETAAFGYLGVKPSWVQSL